MKLKLSDWASVAEIVAALGIVVSLIYVALEVHDNTRAQDAANIQEISRDARDIAASVPVEVRTKVRSGEPISPTEEREYRVFLFATFRAYESWWLQRELGTLSDDVFDAYISSIRITFDDSFSRDYWSDELNVDFLPGFEAYVGEYLNANPLSE